MKCSRMILQRVISSLAYRVAETRMGADIIVRTASPHLGSTCYRRLHQLGFRPEGSIDIGAYQGDWTREALRVFPSVPTLMIEAREEERASLDRMQAELPNVAYEIALLGSRSIGAVKFVVSSTGSSLFEEQSNAARSYRDIPMRRLDDVVREHSNLQVPSF